MSSDAPALRAAAPERGIGGGLYYGWVLVIALGITETVSYGILSYAFPVFIAPMEAELGWSRAQLTGAFSLGSLVAGLAAVPVGRWVDRHGARGVMTAGSALAAALLLGWSRADTLWAFYAIWAGLGLASAAVLYEPAFAVLANWFDRLRGRALTVLTFLGGFASIVFVPLATWLVATHGWRVALVWLAGILALLTIPAHGLLLRRRPQDHGLVPDGGALPTAAATLRPIRDEGVPASVAVRRRSFHLLAVAFALSSLATTALAVHLIPLLLERGHTATFAGAAMGTLGLFALPGRLIFTPLGDRVSRPGVTAAIFLLQALAVLVLLTVRASAGVWVFVVLFGAGFGAVTPARAALVAEFYGPAAYGSIGGVLALVLALARSAAPVGASLVHQSVGGYPPVLALVLVACLASAAAVAGAGASAARAG